MGSWRLRMRHPSKQVNPPPRQFSRDRGMRWLCPRSTLGAGGRLGGSASSRCCAGSSLVRIRNTQHSLHRLARYASKRSAVRTGLAIALIGSRLAPRGFTKQLLRCSRASLFDPNEEGSRDPWLLLVVVVVVLPWRPRCSLGRRGFFSAQQCSRPGASHPLRRRLEQLRETRRTTQSRPTPTRTSLNQTGS